jgi:enoyl-CoA hydratase/carnithine racemase
MNARVELVDSRREGGLLIITLQREYKRNAVDRVLADALDHALNAFEDDPDLRVGVLTGGRTVFSAGSDLRSRGDYTGRALAAISGTDDMKEGVRAFFDKRAPVWRGR